MSTETADGHTMANVLERGNQLIQQFPDHTVSELAVSHFERSLLLIKIAPYALRPDVMRMLMMSGIDGRPIVGKPNKPNFGLYNLRLSSHTSFPDGLHAIVSDASPSQATYNPDKLPFPPEKAAATRHVGEAIAALAINVSKLKVSYPLPPTGLPPVTAEIMGSFPAPEARHDFERTLNDELAVIAQFDDVPNRHGVTVAHYDCATPDGSIPFNFTMFQGCS